MSESDLGMIYIAQLGLVAKVHVDAKGKFVKIPRLGKCYLEKKQDFGGAFATGSSQESTDKSSKGSQKT